MAVKWPCDFVSFVLVFMEIHECASQKLEPVCLLRVLRWCLPSLAQNAWTSARKSNAGSTYGASLVHTPG